MNLKKEATMSDLEIQDLHVSVEGKEILKGVTLNINHGEVIAIMGPNGSGKSTLANCLMGNPEYKVTSGKIKLFGEDITSIPPHKRAHLGLFLSFQYPREIPGVSVSNFLRTALNSLREKEIPVPEFIKLLKEKMDLLKIDHSFMSRYVNEGFSGGEKKRTEILQMAVLEPKIAILDETDSGTDVDSLKIISNGIKKLMSPEKSIVIITHYKKILEYLKPDKIHIMMDGKIVKSDGPELAEEIDKKGYSKYISSK